MKQHLEGQIDPHRLVQESPVAFVSEALAFCRESAVHQGISLQGPGSPEMLSP